MKTKRCIVGILVAGAAALACLVACQKERGNDNPNYDPNKNEVNAQFVFNLSSLAKTKQTGDSTQVNAGHFRGISNAYLMSMISTAEGLGPYVENGILVEDHDLDKIYDLSSVLTPSSIAGMEGRRVLEMSLPLRTDLFVFYGRSSEPAAADYAGYGHLDKYTVGKEAGSANFQLGKRLTDGKHFRTAEKLMGAILTLIMQTTVGTAYKNHNQIKGGVSEGDKKYIYDLSESTDVAAGGYPDNISWESYKDGLSPYDGQPLRPMEMKLQYLYTQMTTERAAELRAASGEAVKKIVQDLWSVVNSVRCAEPTCEAEAVAKYFAATVSKHIAKYFKTSTIPDDGTSITISGFQTMSDIVEAFDADANPTAASGIASLWPNTTKAAAEKPNADSLATLKLFTLPLTNFPLNFNIPRGAAYMKYSAAGKCFYYPQDFNVSAFGGNPDETKYNASSYYFPAELLYFGNSPIRATSKETSVSYPDADDDWEADGSWSDDWKVSGESDKVLSSTRKVAMKFSINYGVSMLKTRIQYAQGTIEDNRAAVLKLDDPGSTEGNQTIALTDDSFILTGIIIGGQPQNVGWDFLPIKDPEGNKATPTYGFVFDSAIASDAKAIPVNGKSNPNYTVVFDNYKTGNTQDKVYVALEFKNNTQKDIYGNVNLIKNGGYFYLIGVLDPAQASSGITWPTTGPYIPPFNTDGSRSNVTRVFVQDFMTDVTFTFGVNSLAAAYLTVPDLRSSSMTLGLSVDLNWRQGLVYNNVPLGGGTN